MTVKQNWFQTLNEALMAEGLLDAWDITFGGISYGQNFRWQHDGEHISIFRENDGRYERPIHYRL